MEQYVKIFPINEYLRRKEIAKIVSISELGQHHIIAVFEKGGEG